MTKLNRRVVLKELLRERGDLIVIAGLGASAWDLAACGNESLDFPLWGAMGSAAMVGMGMALAQPERKVLVITGDGEMLMGFGSLATIGTQQLDNLSIVVLDNECYGETGRQTTHTGMGVDLASVAGACGFTNVRTVTQADELAGLREDIQTVQGPLFATVKVSTDELPRVLPPRDGPYLTQRMREALHVSES